MLGNLETLEKITKKFHDYMTPTERKIWEAMCKLSKRKRTVDWTEINQALGTNYSLTEIERHVENINRKMAMAIATH